MKNIKYVLFLICFVFFGQQILAQSTSTKKLSKRQQDRLYLKRPASESLSILKKDIQKKWNKTFTDFTVVKRSLLAGISFGKQNIREANYHSTFNYSLSDNNNNVSKPGYFAGYRIDGVFKEKHDYSFTMSLNKIATGANYKTSKSLEPFIGGFSNFKSDGQMLTLGIAAHYKKLIPILDTTKYKFYVVGGPDFEIRLSNQSLDNQVKNNYRKLFLRADLGIEFDNKDYYTIFLHYKQGLHSITKSPIKDYMNSFELGLFIKASDLF